MFSTDQELSVREKPGSVESPQPTTKATPIRLYLKPNPFSLRKLRHRYHKIDINVRLLIANPFANPGDSKTDSANVSKKVNNPEIGQDFWSRLELAPEYKPWLLLILLGCLVVHVFEAITPHTD